MNYPDFRRQVAAYLNRNPNDLTVNGIDLVLTAFNKARRQAQRLVDFEQLRCSVDITVNLTTGGALSSAVVHGGTDSVTINRIERAYLSINGQLRPVDFTTRSTLAARLKRTWDTGLCWNEWLTSNSVYLPSTPLIVRHGDTLYCHPGNAPVFNGNGNGNSASSVTVTLDVVKLLPDYDNTGNLNLDPLNSSWPSGFSSLDKVGLYGDYPLYGNAGPGVETVWAYYNFITSTWWITDSLSSSPGFASRYWEAASSGPLALTSTSWLDRTSNGGTLTASLDPASASVLPTDFFLTNYEEWLMFFVIRQLEYHNKDKEKFVVTQSMLDEAWKAVLADNNSISDSGSAEEYDLD